MMLNRSGATPVIRTMCWMFLCSTQFGVTDGLNCSILVVGGKLRIFGLVVGPILRSVKVGTKPFGVLADAFVRWWDMFPR